MMASTPPPPPPSPPPPMRRNLFERMADASPFSNVIQNSFERASGFKAFQTVMREVIDIIELAIATTQEAGEEYHTDTFGSVRRGLQLYEAMVTELSRIYVDYPARSLGLLQKIVESLRGDRDFLSDLSDFSSELQHRYDVALPLSGIWDNTLAIARDKFAQGTALLPFSDASPKLNAIVPDQKAAPAKFIFVDDILRLDRTPSQPAEGVEHVSDSARRELLESCGQLQKMLRASGNIDARIGMLVEQLRERIAARDNIVQLGMANISAELVFKAAADELPDAIAGMLAGLNRGIGMYAAQFPDWQLFAENAAAVDLAELELAPIKASAENFAAELEAMPDRVDPEVPKTLRFLLALWRDPTDTSKRAIFAVIRTFENLISSVVKRASELADAALDGAGEGTKKFAKHAVFYALLGLAIHAGTTIWPAASRMVDAKWIGEVVEGAKQQIAKAE